jgi:hypothetical protein
MEAAAVVDIGLTRAEFWELTPRRFQAMLDRFMSREIHRDRQQQILTTIFANVYRDPKERAAPYTIDDFAPAMPGTDAKPKFDGPPFLRPCDECGVPKWQGHSPYCETGRKHFEGILAAVSESTQNVHTLVDSVGKVYLEPKQ